jgi:N-acetylglucosaminyldiphosphoundecaprenol N-acetyl-beta-D-mannosaminyltransferase
MERAAQFTWDRSAGDLWAQIQGVASTAPASSENLQAHRGTESGQGVRGSAVSPRIPILGLPVDNLSWEQTLARIETMVDSGSAHQIATANPEFLMRARREPDFMDVLLRADLVLPDGVGFMLASRWQGRRFEDQITGSDLTPRLAALAAAKDWHLYLLGAAPGVAALAAERLRERYPALNVTADGSDPAPDGPPALLARIRTARPDILLVAYGAPKQDYWIDRFGRTTGVPVQLGIGGSLDFVAGIVPRAPESWRKWGLEWLWRLKEEPWRWRRMLALPHFAVLAAVEAVRIRLSTGARRRPPFA